MNLPARKLMLIVVGMIAMGSWIAFAADERSSGTASNHADSDMEVDAEEAPYVAKTKRELQRSLTRLQFDVTQNEATEPAFRNLYWNNKKEGVYKCIVCDRELFHSKTKYESGTGWPSFYAPVDEKNIGTRKDYRLFYSRIEVHCSRCNAHLGHVFEDGPKPTGLRYCMNSASLKFVEKPKSAEEETSE